MSQQHYRVLKELNTLYLADKLCCLFGEVLKTVVSKVLSGPGGTKVSDKA